MTLGFLFRSKNFCKLVCLCWEVFVLHGYDWMDPLGGQVLHHDCTSIIVSRFTTFTENFVICCYQVTKIFCTKYGSAIASSSRSPCNLGPLTDLAVSVFREVSIHCDYPNRHFSWLWALKRLHEKNWRVWVSAFRDSIIHEIFSKFLQPFRNVGTQRVSPFFLVVLVCICFWIFGWLGQWVAPF